jgi:thiaminase (transcriptional activator TenA)
VSFSEELKSTNIDKWNKILSHKFIIEIAEDTLPIGKFVFYLKQDQIFLNSFCDLLAAAARITYDKQTKLWFESLIHTTSKYEMPMQNEILYQLEGNPESIEVSAEETTLKYTSYMKRVSDSNNLAIIVSAMAPCPWTYYEISEALIKTNIKTEAYKKWLRFYSSKESEEQVNQMKNFMNKLANSADEQKQIDMKNHFSVSCNYELGFWNMAYSHRQYWRPCY